MRLKRRDFLVLGTVSAFGLTLVWKNLLAVVGGKTDAKVAIAEPTLTSQASIITAKPPLLRFVSVADTGTGAQGQYAVARAMTGYHRQNPYDIVILAGDNIYNNGEIEKINAVFEKPYQDLLKQGVKFYACLGNHDIRTANGDPQVNYPGFNMQGRRYYTFRRDPVQFFALDTNPNADWEKELVWLEQELSNSDAPWKVVFSHYQIYSSGLYGVNQDFVKIFTPLFQKYKVQLYINGHDHNYERTRSINGTTYMISGGGAGVRQVGRSEWTEYSAGVLSFAAFDVYEDRMVVSGIGTDGRVFDRGVIQLG